MEKETVKSAADRGSADAYYGRKFNPHYLKPNEHGGHDKQPVEKDTAEYDAYHHAYVNEDDRKDWGQ